MSGNTISPYPARSKSPKDEVSPTADARQNSVGGETIINEEEPTEEEKASLRRGMIAIAILHYGRLTS